MTETASVTACRPSNPWLASTARIQSIRAETPGVATYGVVFDDPALAQGFKFLPGQFNRAAQRVEPIRRALPDRVQH